MRQATEIGGQLPQPGLGAGVGEDVRAFGDPDVGGHRHERDAGDQTAGDREHCGGGGGGQHSDLPGTADALGNRRGRPDEITSGQHGAVDAHGVADVGSGGDGRPGSRRPAARREATEDTGLVKPITQLSSREVYRNNWMSVREDIVERPDGSTGIHGVVDRPDYAVVIAVDGDRLAMVEQYRYPMGARRWEFPMGTTPDQPDIDPRELAARELREETGLTAGSLTVLGRLDVARES